MTDRPTCLECNAPEGEHHTDECSQSGVVGAEQADAHKTNGPVSAPLRDAFQARSDAQGNEVTQAEINELEYDSCRADAQPTPRTDALFLEYAIRTNGPALYDGVRQLERALAQSQADLAAETEARQANDIALNNFMKKGVCPNCYGTGRLSNHVEGEIECGECNGTGQGNPLTLPLAEALDELTDVKLEFAHAQTLLAAAPLPEFVAMLQSQVNLLKSELGETWALVESERAAREAAERMVTQRTNSNRELMARLATVEAALQDFRGATKCGDANTYLTLVRPQLQAAVAAKKAKL